MIKRVIVTGGTGVTGNALVRYLLNQNIEVTALIRSNSKRKEFLPLENKLLNVVECSMNEYNSIDSKLTDKYDAFFHLSWDGSTGKEKVDNRNNFKLQNQNVTYAIDAVDLCNKIKCPVFIMTGSQAEYGRKNHEIVEEDVKNPENGYGMAKLCAEGMTRILCKKYGIRHVWPILFSVYGPYDGTESLIDTSIRGLLQNKYLDYTAGEQIWDFLYSYDAAKALLLLAEKGRDGECYNVANGNAKGLKEYIKIIYNIVEPNKTPNLGKVPYAENQVMYLYANINKLKDETGFFPEFDFESGIRKVVELI